MQNPEIENLIDPKLSSIAGFALFAIVFGSLIAVPSMFSAGGFSTAQKQLKPLEQEFVAQKTELQQSRKNLDAANEQVARLKEEAKATKAAKARVSEEYAAAVQGLKDLQKSSSLQLQRMESAQIAQAKQFGSQISRLENTLELSTRDQARLVARLDAMTWSAPSAATTSASRQTVDRVITEQYCEPPIQYVECEPARTVVCYPYSW